MSAISGKDRVALFLIGVGLSVVLVVTLRLQNDAFSHGAPFGRDFVNFWLGGRFALRGELAALTDFVIYNETAERTFGYLGDFFVFSYPPLILPFLTPFGAAPYLPALLVWTAINLTALACATRLFSGESRVIAAACLSPAAFMMVLYGHFTGVLALLATTAVGASSRRPALAGLCLAAMSVKPQFAAAFGLILLLAGRWRALAWSAGGFALLAALSLALYGLEPWLGFLTQTLAYQTWLLDQFIFEALLTVISPYAALRRLGVADPAATLVQYGLGAILLWRCGSLLRRNPTGAAGMLPILLGGLIALPYANHYDMAIVAPAMAATFFAARAEEPRVLAPIPALLLWVSPLLAMLGRWEHAPVGAILICGLALYLAFRPQPTQMGPPSPAAP